MKPVRGMERIRITGGELRGRVIKSPKSDLTHPMGAREKLALFNMIGRFLPSAKVLDAYAGSGALGIEALSRGAARVIFIEKSPKVVKIIHENLRLLGAEDKSSVYCCNVLSFDTEMKFDVILADPPYDNFVLSEIEHLSRFLQKGGILALSHTGMPPALPGLELVKSRNYARATISIYTNGSTTQ